MTIWHQIWSLAFAIGIVGNLVASALWAGPALIHIHRKLDRHHAEHMKALNEQFRVGDINSNSVPNVAPNPGNWPTD